MIRRSAEPGSLPDLLAACLGKALFEVPDVGVLATDAVGEVRDVGQKGLFARAGAGRGVDLWFGSAGGDGGVQVGVAVDEAAVDSGGPRNG